MCGGSCAEAERASRARPSHYNSAMPPDDPRRYPTLDAVLDQCATPMAVADRALAIRSLNPALHEWLGGGTRAWRGEALALLDAKPPALADAALRAFREERRVLLRGGRLRAALGDRDADLALTPLDAQTVLVEVQAVTAGHTNLRLSESLRGFAHEVKGPLAGVRGAAQLLQRRVADAELAELAQLIVNEADRLAALSDRLLNAGAAAQREAINVHESIERSLALIAAEAAATAIRRDYDPSLPPIAADADRLQQALLNLLRNAVEAKARSVGVRTRVEHSPRLGGTRVGVRIDVADDGDGVPAQLAETLFEPLVSGRADGTGLGLAIAREIAHEHGGELAYVSRPGATVFSLLLPLNG